MTQEEKSKAYDEALERAKKLYAEAKANEYASDMQDYEFIFPELRESEDEKAKKIIASVFCGVGYRYIQKSERDIVLAYLEKQKEQKPKNILTDDDSLQTAYLKGQTDVLEDPEAYGLQKEQKPAEWSEVDEAMLANIFGTYKTLEDMLDLSTGQDRDILESMNFERDWLKDRFKSLCLQPKQEWSEEDKKTIRDAIDILNYEGYKTNAEALKSLRPSWKPS